MLKPPSQTRLRSPFPHPVLLRPLVRVYPTIPAKHAFVSGLFACLLSGAMASIFSFFLSHLLFEVSANPGAVTINSYGAFVLGIAAVGLLMGLKSFLMEMSVIRWVTLLCNLAYFSRAPSGQGLVQLSCAFACRTHARHH